MWESINTLITALSSNPAMLLLTVVFITIFGGGGFIAFKILNKFLDHAFTMSDNVQKMADSLVSMQVDIRQLKDNLSRLSEEHDSRLTALERSVKS